MYKLISENVSKKKLSMKYKFIYCKILFLCRFTQDPETYSIDTQFLWGPALMIIPVLEVDLLFPILLYCSYIHLQENAVEVSAYIPAGIWYDFYTKSSSQGNAGFYNLSAPLDTIPLLLRGGYILPQQDPKPTTTESRKSKIELLVASDANGMAEGQLYWDDGDSLSKL